MSGKSATLSPWRALRQSGQLTRLLVLCAGVWLHAADSLLVATLMPDAARELGGVAFMGWTIALYIVGSIVAGASGGRLAMRFGVRRAMAGAALVFAAGCLVSALSWTMPLMLLGRLIQGAGGGAMLALTFVGLEGLFPSRLMGPVMAVISSVWGASAFCGPLVGGAFAHFGFWRLGFGAFAVQALALAVLTLALLPRGGARPASGEAVPFGRLGLLALAIVAVAASGNLSALPLSAAALLLGLGLLAVFFRADRAAGEPLLPRAAARPGSVTGAGILFVMFFAAATVAFTVYGPLLLQLRFGVSPLVGGYVVAAESLCWTLAAVSVAQAGPRAEPWIIRGGALIASLGVLAMPLTLPAGPLWSIVAATAALGFGFGAFWAFVVRRVVDSVGAAEKERASAALPTAQLIGYAAGAALAGLFANAAGFADGADADDARSVGFWLYAGFVPVLAAGWLFVPRLSGRQIERQAPSAG